MNDQPEKGPPERELRTGPQFHNVSGRRSDSASWIDAQKRGTEAERRVMAAIESKIGFVIIPTLQGSADADLISLGRIEVKRDDLASSSGNVAVEVSRNGFKSGARVTNAEVWAFVVGDAAYVMPTARLIELLDTQRYRAVPGGDGRRTWLVLVPLIVIQTMSVRLDLGKAGAA